MANRISKKKEFEIYSKFNGCCAYCGNLLTLVYDNIDCMQYMQIDHFVPKIKNGKDNIENLYPSCQKCNRLKNKKTVEQFRIAYWFKEKSITPFTSKQINFLLKNYNLDLMKIIKKEIIFYMEK